MNNTLTEKELEQLLRLEVQLEKVRKAFHGKTVQIRGDTVLVSVLGSNAEFEYNLKDLLRAIRKKEQGANERRSTSKVASKSALATYGRSATRRKMKKAVSVATGSVNNTARAEVRAMKNRLRALRLAERQKKKALREAAAGGAGTGAGAGAGARVSSSRSTSSSNTGSAHSNNNMNELAAGLGDMSVAEVKSEIKELEEALERMGL